MKRIALTVALLLGGTAVAHANPPGMTPGPMPQDAQDQVGPGGGWMGPRGPMARGPRADRGDRGPRADRGDRGDRGDRAPRAERRRLPPQVKARLVARFDRDQDGRLQGPERRAARQFLRQLHARRAMARQHRGGARGQRF